MIRLRLSIDRILADKPGIDRQALEQALRVELARMVGTVGAGSFAAGGTLPTVRARLEPAAGPLPTQIAAAVARAVSAKPVTP